MFGKPPKLIQRDHVRQGNSCHGKRFHVIFKRITMEAMDKKAKLTEERAQDKLLLNEKGKAKKQEEALIMMMKMQMKEQQERSDRELEEAMAERFAPSPIESTGEVHELRMLVENLEAKMDDMYIEVDEKKNENKQLCKLLPPYLV